MQSLICGRWQFDHAMSSPFSFVAIASLNTNLVAGGKDVPVCCQFSHQRNPENNTWSKVCLQCFSNLSHSLCCEKNQLSCICLKKVLSESWHTLYPDVVKFLLTLCSLFCSQNEFRYQVWRSGSHCHGLWEFGNKTETNCLPLNIQLMFICSLRCV